jgi:hypothetical protein
VLCLHGGILTDYCDGYLWGKVVDYPLSVRTRAKRFSFFAIGRNWEIRMDPLGGGTPGPIVESKYGGSGTR